MPNITTFAEANKRLAVFYDNARTNYTLDNMRQLMDFLDNPQERYRVLHVAGTSGKTSTAYYAAALLTAAGHKTGLTVSPHVDEINERVQINMQPASEVEFCAALDEFLTLIERAPVRPSWFEAMVAFAYWYFARTQVEYAVVEVGLGGLKDGTNVIKRADKVCIITDIGLDHTQILGNTLAEIAAQKAGIIQPHNHVFAYNQGREVMDVIRAAAERQKATLHIETLKPDAESSGLPSFQKRNLQLAERAVEFMLARDGQLPLTSEQRRAAARTYIPARMEMIKVGHKTVVVDGAHNAQKLGVLIDSLHVKYPRARFAALVAFADSDEQRLAGALEALQGLTDTFMITSFVTAKDYLKRSIDPRLVAERLRAKGASATVVPEPAAALQELLACPEDVLVVTGSFYLLNHIRPHLPGKGRG